MCFYLACFKIVQTQHFKNWERLHKTQIFYCFKTCKILPHRVASGLEDKVQIEQYIHSRPRSLILSLTDVGAGIYFVCIMQTLGIQSPSYFSPTTNYSKQMAASQCS